MMGFTNAQSLMNTDFLMSHLSFMAYGRYHTLQSPFSLAVRYIVGAMRILLDDKIRYYIFVHDINYFVMNMNPFAMPLDAINIRLD